MLAGCEDLLPSFDYFPRRGSIAIHHQPSTPHLAKRVHIWGIQLVGLGKPIHFGCGFAALGKHGRVLTSATLSLRDGVRCVQRHPRRAKQKGRTRPQSGQHRRVYSPRADSGTPKTPSNKNLRLCMAKQGGCSPGSASRSRPEPLIGQPLFHSVSRHYRSSLGREISGLQNKSLLSPIVCCSLLWDR